MRRPQAIARQHTFVQAAQFFHYQSVHVCAVGRRHLGIHQFSNDIERLAFWQHHHSMHCLLQELTSDKPHRFRLCQLLPDQQILLRRAFIGPEIDIAQQLHTGHFVNAQHGVRVRRNRYIEKS